MLVKLEKEDIGKYIDFAYELSLDLSKSCYPTYADGIKTKEDFISIAQKSFDKEKHEIYLFYYQDKLEGWIHYYYIPEDNYFCCEVFSIRNHIEIAFQEFMKYVEQLFKGYEFYFGCSIKNIDAIKFLEKNGFDQIEESQVCLLNFNEYILKNENQNIRQITETNYSDFVELHKPFDEEMYWDCNHILEDIKNWHIYALYVESKAVATIYFVRSGVFLEIFGIDFKGNKYNENHFRDLMIKALNEGKKLGAKHLYYFSENNEARLLESLDYRWFDTYRCYLRKI